MQTSEVKVIERKLGRENVYGLADIDNKIIELDPRMKPKKYMEILLHEKLHLLFPDWSENKVNKTAKALGKLMWDNKYRKVAL